MGVIMLNISSLRRLFSLFTFFTLLILVNQSYPQFSVVSFSPNHGSTNVDTSVNITMTFSAPLDTSARFPNPEDFFLNLYIFPDSLIGEHDSIAVSQDLTTVNVYGLSIVDNTTYLFMIVNAKSQGGDSLSSPARSLFTTGSSLPGNSISGAVSFPSGDPTGTAVFLFDGNPFNDSGSAVNASIVPNSSGNYVIDDVEPGTYWPVAVKNLIVNEESEVDILPGSVLGFYDSNGDDSPDSLNVSGNVSGIDISITELTLQTARDPYPSVLTVAQTWAADARLIQLGGDALDPNGNSLFWRYAFYSPSSMTYRIWMVLGNTVANVPPDSGDMFTDTSAVSENWLNSDVIMSIAEANGGSQFRQEHSDADAGAFLGQLSFENDRNGSSSHNLDSGINIKFSSKVRKVFSAEDNIYFSSLTSDQSIDLPVVWGVQYYSNRDNVSQFMIIDAESGELLSAPTTAALAEQHAVPVAQSWAADAKLLSISNHNGAGSFVDLMGKTQSWACFYYSPALDSSHIVFVMGQLPLFEQPGGIPPDTATVANGWLDSDVTVAEAEANGGTAYRNSNQDVLLFASLSRWFFGQNPELTIWQFNYTSSNAPPLQILVNAITGNVITAIDNPAQNSLPGRFVLYHNYPNPFNPTTNISFNLPTSDQVKIEIFNIRGQKVYTLNKGQLIAGFHEVMFDASELASGIYIYRLTTPTQTAMKKMVLLK
jgi:hypothetical protein